MYSSRSGKRVKRIRQQLSDLKTGASRSRDRRDKTEAPRIRTSAGPARRGRVQRAAHDGSNRPALNLALSSQDGRETVVVSGRAQLAGGLASGHRSRPV